MSNQRHFKSVPNPEPLLPTEPESTQQVIYCWTCSVEAKRGELPGVKRAFTWEPIVINQIACPIPVCIDHLNVIKQSPLAIA